MSREIKFRAWDKENEEYRNGYDVLLKYDGSAISRYALGALDTDMPVNVIIEQYTGLKDKNGKEIYEGDIVEGDMGVFEVKWYDLVSQFMFRPNMSMKYHPPFTSTQLEVMKVIGNIHENPELLGGEE